MNYITLNGYKSTLIKGLLISELPPITKPLQRTNIEEIDGRDGDIITRLGYAAYDKKMTIGCYGDFNIDDIIQYFNSEGEVVFSNEPDKYYKYTILNQIDFERLCRFKKATVVFHVQPFKFSAVDDTLEYNVFNYSQMVRNNGNVISRPKITLYGTGSVSLTMHGDTFLCIMSQNDYITLDGTTLNAYKDNVLKNRVVSGDLRNLWLPVGDSEITWTGTLTKMIIKDGSRWI